MPQLLSAKPVIEKIRAELSQKIFTIQQKRGYPPGLAVVIVGDDPASVIYTRRKGEMAESLGMFHVTMKFPASASPKEVFEELQRLNSDPKIDGILIQRPLPRQFNEREVLLWVDPKKDVDAFHPQNVGNLILGLPCFLPCTPAGIMELLKFYNISIAGKVACVVGRSSIVGKPMHALLLQHDATVLQCHSRTPDIRKFTTQADLLVVAAGKPHLIHKEHIKPGAVVIDVGIHRNAEGKIVGDVAFDHVAPITSAITPVPGGVGPMTILTLMQNTCAAATS